jgi:predicted GNAT family acetyltransferase
MNHRIQSYIRIAASNGRETERIGPFLATFDPHDSLRYLSYAIPDDSAEPTPQDVAALVRAYRSRDRLPRLEFLPAVAPAAERALLEQGFEIEARLPVMTCASSDAVDLRPPEGIVIERPETAEDVRGILMAQHAAFDTPAPNDEAVARAMEGRELRLLARDASTGLVVGGGIATIPVQATSEIAGIGVLAEYRRRGIAGAITSRLSRDLFDAGVSAAFLTPGDDGAHSVYARAGFADTTEILHLSA